MFWALLLRAVGLSKRLWAIIRAYPMQAACIALVVACLWLWSGKNAASDRADRMTELRRVEADNHRTTK
ncbi:MAG TPA: hypothetical protein PLM58_09300, partial [Novosphingobium sp.]|nr:hypothetical protein [Novosphingobium sp.]